MATIMLVEDDPGYRMLLRDLCKGEGHNVLEASSAVGALRQLGAEGAFRRPPKFPELFIRLVESPVWNYALAVSIRCGSTAIP